MKKRDTTRLIDMLVQTYGATTISLVLDAFKDLGFKYATQAGITISKNDVVVPPEKQAILDKYDKLVGDITGQYDDGPDHPGGAPRGGRRAVERGHRRGRRGDGREPRRRSTPSS